MAEAGRFPPPNQTGAGRRRGRRAYGSDPNRYRGLRQPGARRGIRAAAEPGHGAGGRVYPTPALQPHSSRRPAYPCIRWTPWTGWRAPSTCCCSAAAAPPTFRSRAPGTPDAFTWWTASTPTRTFPPTLPPWMPRPGPVGRRPSSPRGVDPGLFSLVRALAAAVLPCGESYTFWGRGVSQGPLRRRPPHPRRPGRAAVHHPGPRRPGCGAQRRQSGADHPAEAHAGVLCGGGGGGRPGPHRAGDHHHAPLLCRLRHHGALFSLRRSCSGTTAACPTAALSSAAAARAGRNRTGPWWNSN